jgi:hypothetical protein
MNVVPSMFDTSVEEKELEQFWWGGQEDMHYGKSVT